MTDSRIKVHPVLEVPEKETVSFFWNHTPLTAKKDEMISSALFANHIKIFGHHHKDGSAQGIFCANGQCAKCTVIADGVPVKACMTPVRDKMRVESVEGLPRLPDAGGPPKIGNVEQIHTDVLIIGGGPAGLSAAIQLEEHGIRAVLVDDKDELGGKLVLQTHKFFGSVEDSHAGMRGMDIGRLLAQKVEGGRYIDVWKKSTVLYVFDDKKVGILKDGVYKLLAPKMILNAAGARVTVVADPKKAVAGADVVNTDVWASMGQEDEQQQRAKNFEGFCVDEDLLALARPDAIVLASAAAESCLLVTRNTKDFPADDPRVRFPYRVPRA